MLPAHWEINDPVRRKKAGKRVKRFYFGKEPVSNLTLENLVNVSTKISKFHVLSKNIVNPPNFFVIPST